MAGPTFSMAFVMDPIEAINIQTDTTFVLMLEAQARGHQVWVIDPGDLGAEGGHARAWARPVQLRREPGRHAEAGPEVQVELDAAFDAVFQRKDPPVDTAYVRATQILSLCKQSLVLNRPEGILSANEKLYALHFPQLMTETLVSRRADELLEFMASVGGEMILKPLDGRGGEGVFHLHGEDRNLFSILEQSTAFQTRPVMAQRYLPEIRRGDKRILLLDGEPLGAVLRVPSARETRANLHVGGRAARSELDADDRRIVETLGPALRRDGLFFVGIDVIGGRLTEVNVTSPTGMQEINRLQGSQLEARVIDAVEARILQLRR